MSKARAGSDDVGAGCSMACPPDALEVSGAATGGGAVLFCAERVPPVCLVGVEEPGAVPPRPKNM